jgi:hypothetical protein
MVSNVTNSRPVVEALPGNGADDLLEILPTTVEEGGYTIGDIERAIALFDLPRPQLSLQVWSYQISAKVENPIKTYRIHQLRQDDAREALENINARVQLANRNLTKALQSGMWAIYKEAAQGTFFDPDFHDYLGEKYYNCVAADHYCLGYYNALDVPRDLTEDLKEAKTAKEAKESIDASLSRLLLLVASASDSEAPGLVEKIVEGMQSALVPPFSPQPSSSTSSAGQPLDSRCEQRCEPVCPPWQRHRYLENFREALIRAAGQKTNLHRLRAAFLDFFFTYKWTINYYADFVPYDLRHAAHALDNLLQPINEAFNHDIDQYVQDMLDDECLVPKTPKTGLINQGMVQVSVLSGVQATVSGEIKNYFNITETPPLSQVAQSLLGGTGGGGGGGGNSGGGSGSGGSGGGGGGKAAASGGGSGGSGAAAAGAMDTSSLQGLISNNPYVLGGMALADILAPPKVHAQLAKGVSLTVTPTALDTASSAELNVALEINEPDGGLQTVNSNAVTQDLLDRVASHTVTTTVRVQSLKLFDLSTLAMEITHPQTPTCLPTTDTDPWKTLSYFAAVPYSVPCAVWRSVFGSMPGASRIFEWPRKPVTVDNRSIAIIRAVVVPTAMDLGEALDYVSDRVVDPVTNTTEALSSIQQLGWKARVYHKLLMQCIATLKSRNCTLDPELRLSNIPEDVRNPLTN